MLESGNYVFLGQASIVKIVDLENNLSNYKYLFAIIKKKDTDTIVGSSIIPTTIFSLLDTFNERIIVSSHIDTLYESDFYYVNNSQINVVALSNVTTVFFYGIK